MAARRQPKGTTKQAEPGNKGARMSYLSRLSTVFVLSPLAIAAHAQTYQNSVDPGVDRAELVSQPDLAYPNGNFRSGQEAWVSINYVIAAGGEVEDPIVVDSIGGVVFEQQALDNIRQWRFAPSADGRDIGNNTAEFRFEMQRGRDKATSQFMRRYRDIIMNLYNEDTVAAREAADQAAKIGGWNLYESTMLCLMLGRVEDQEGDLHGKREHYERALEASNSTSLKGKDRRDVLARIFEAEYATGQYGSAMKTIAVLKSEPNSDASVAALQGDIDKLGVALAARADLHAQGRLAAPCNCDAGEALWQYEPARQQFSFANLDGNVSHFEARCNSERVQGRVDITQKYTLPEAQENCRLFVFGDNGASFELIEHPAATDNKSAEVVNSKLASAD
jgi:TonB family protein